MRRRLRPIATAVSGLVVLLCSTTVAHAATCLGSGGKTCAYDRIATYGQGSPGELHTPLGVAVGPDGRIYVVDTTDRADLGDIDVYGRDGRFLGALRPNDGGVFAPRDVGVSAAGVVYALDPEFNLVHRFAADGAYRRLFLSAVGRSVRAEHIAVQRDGSYWVLYRNGVVEHYDAGGVIAGGFTAPGNATGIGVDADGHVHIGGQNNGFTEYAPSGAVLGTTNALPGFYLAFTGDGALLSAWGDSLSRTPAAGGGYAEIGSGGSAPGRFNQIAGVAVAPAGVLAAGRPGEEAYVVVDRDNHRVQIIAPDGAPLALVGAPQGSTLFAPRVAWGLPDGGMVVGDTRNSRLVRFGASGAFGGRVDGGGFIYPSDGAYDPTTGGSVVSDVFSIRRFAANGTLLDSWPMPGVVEGTSHGSHGGGVAVAPDGTIWAAHSPEPRGGFVFAYAPDGTPQRSIEDAHVDRPSGLAVGPGGEVHVLEAGSGQSVVDVFGPGGEFRRRLGGLGCGSTQSIAVDGAGRVYAGLGGGVAVFDRSGALLARFGSRGSQVGQFGGTQLSVLGDVLTIAEQDNNRVTRVRINPSALGTPERAPCGSVSLGSTSVLVQGTRAFVSLGCNGSLALSCDGSLTLVRRSANTAKKLRTKDVIASSAFRVSGRGTATVKLKAADRRVLRKKGRLAARLLVRPKLGGPISRAVVLRAAAARAPKATKTKAKSKTTSSAKRAKTSAANR